MVISGVADRVPERLALLVYLDAEVPMDGRASWIYCPRKSGLATRKQPDPRGRGG